MNQLTIKTKWDKSGLKEASQRALSLGRTHQEFDIQLLLDMLLEIERLESLLDSPKPAGSSVSTLIGYEAGYSDGEREMRDACVEKVKSTPISHGPTCGESYCACGAQQVRNELVEAIGTITLEAAATTQNGDRDASNQEAKEA